MFQRILVPLDGSPRAERALPLATRLAQASGGTVVLLRVVYPSTERVKYPVDVAIVQEITDDELQEARNSLEALRERSRLSGVHTEITVVEGQDAATILSVTEAQHIDLIVLCSHGYTGLKRWVLGSVAEKVARYASVPVLLLRESGPALVDIPPRAEGPLRALVPLDGSAHAREALVPAAQLIAALATPGCGALHLMRVVVLPDSAKISPVEREAIIYKARQYLIETVKQIREGLVASPLVALKLAITWSITIDDDCAAGIIRVAEEGEDALESGVPTRSDVIAMATHGSSGFERWAMGSVTERVLAGTRLPLLIVRPHKHHTPVANIPVQDEGIAG